MLKLVLGFLAVSVALTSCTGYKKSLEVSKNESLSIEDLTGLVPGEKILLTSKGGKTRPGKLTYIDSTSLSVRTYSKEMFHLDINEIKKVKYDESVVKTVINVLGIPVSIVGARYVLFYSVLPF